MAVGLAGCGGSSSDTGVSVDQGALQLATQFETALKDNSRAEANPLYVSDYSYLNETHDAVVEHDFSGLNAFGTYQFSSAVVQVQSFVPRGGDEADMVVHVDFSGLWSLLPGTPSIPGTVGSAILSWHLRRSAEGSWQITAQRFINSGITSAGANMPTASNININGQPVPMAPPGSPLHVTGAASGAVSLIVIPDLSQPDQGSQVLNLAEQLAGRAAHPYTQPPTDLYTHTPTLSYTSPFILHPSSFNTATNPATLQSPLTRQVGIGSLFTGIVNSLLLIQSRLGNVVTAGTEHFAADVTAPVTTGTVGLTLIAVGFDSDRNVTGAQVQTIPYQVSGTPVPASNLVITTIPVGAGPRGLAINPNTNTIYAANEKDNTVSVIDGVRNNVITTISVGKAPVALAAAFDSTRAINRIYAANSGDNTVSVIDGAANAVIATLPVGVEPRAVAAAQVFDQIKIYVANAGDNTVSVINLAGNIVTRSIPVGVRPTGLTLAPLGNFLLFAANSGDNSVSVIDTTTDKIAAPPPGSGVPANPDGSLPPIPVGMEPVAVAANPIPNQPQSFNIYAANDAADTVSIFSSFSYRAVGTLTVGKNPLALAADNVRSVYVANSGDNTISIIDVPTNTLLPQTIVVGSAPAAVAINPGTNRVYVANSGSSSVTVIAGRQP